MTCGNEMLSHGSPLNWKAGLLVWCLWIPTAFAGSEAYTLQPGDILEISVWKEEGMQKEVLVRPDGGLSFPLVGDALAEGRSVAELSDEIAKKLGEYIPDPVVTVSLREINGNRLYVIGKVNKPGVFPFVSRVDVMQALSMAGGMTPYADVKDIKILRRSEGGEQAIPFNYGDVESGEKLEQNILLQTGDVVVVP